MKRNKIHSGIFFLLLVFSAIVLLYAKPVYAIRIGIITNGSSANVAVSKQGSIIDGFSNRTLLTISAMKLIQLSRNGAGLVANIDGHPYNLGSNYIQIKTSEGGFVFAKRKWYRGSLTVYNGSSGLIVINNVDLESYLMGVVPSEMPSSWNIEAHKAQAIAARSYAIANLGKRARYGFDLKDTPEDQAYGGASSESARTNLAVSSTRGQVLVYGNKVIPAYYHSSSGGYTINSGSIWYKDLPYVKSVPSFDGNLPKRGHGVGMSQYGANNLAKYGYSAYQILGYFYQNVKLYIVNREF